MKTLYDFTQNLLAAGKSFFSKEQALTCLAISEIQFHYQAYRLSRKKIIRRISGGFYMIIPAEYQALGSLPPHWIIRPLMEYLDRKCYYIGLLSAASFYGATEQQPMVFQVIVDKALRKIRLSRSNIEFHVKHYCGLSEISNMYAPTGHVRISTKEQTIVDLVRYYEASGGLGNVALIIKDLGKDCHIRLFKKVVAKEKKTVSLQRLGYLLEFTNLENLAKVVDLELSKRRIFYGYLRPDVKNKIGKRLVRWKLILNDYVEVG